jgi:hypothetical protein
MRPLGWLGVGFIVLGAYVLAMRGLSFTKERESVQVGPLEVAAEKKGFVPPAAGVVALVIGVALVVGGRRRST